MRGSTVPFSAPCTSRVTVYPAAKTTRNSRKSIGETRVSPIWNPSRKRCHNSVISAACATQTKAKTGSEASAMQNPISTGKSPS